MREAKKIIQKESRLVIAKNCSIADSIFLRLKGLLGKANLLDGEALLITPCNSVHTFFMRFAIDVVYLSKELKIIALYKNLVPWRVTGIHFGAKFVLELPEGSISRLTLKKGDVLEIVD